MSTRVPPGRNGTSPLEGRWGNCYRDAIFGDRRTAWAWVRLSMLIAMMLGSFGGLMFFDSGHPRSEAVSWIWCTWGLFCTPGASATDLPAAAIVPWIGFPAVCTAFLLRGAAVSTVERPALLVFLLLYVAILCRMGWRRHAHAAQARAARH
ncbi:MAG TPA: hypothetical protein VN690_08395 [Terriglobales bacterium]|nr:hypothetical protein [Terriglobales bacterium]